MRELSHRDFILSPIEFFWMKTMEEHFLSNIFVNDALLNLTVSSCRDIMREKMDYIKNNI